MSTVSKNLSGFLFNGAALALATADFKAKVNIIYGFNPSGSGYISFKPSSNFNALKQLEQDGCYILDAKSTGFDLPGATFSAKGVAAGVAELSIAKLLWPNQPGYHSPNTNSPSDIVVQASSSEAGDTLLAYVNVPGSQAFGPLVLGGTDNFIPMPGATDSTTYTLTVVNLSGAFVSQQFMYHY